MRGSHPLEDYGVEGRQENKPLINVVKMYKCSNGTKMKYITSSEGLRKDP